MTFKELRKIALSEFYPALFFERLLPHSKRRGMVLTVQIVTEVFVILSILVFGITRANPASSVAAVEHFVYGIFFISLSVWLTMFALQAFCYSFYFQTRTRMTFECAKVLYRTSSKDLLLSLVKTAEGRLIMLRTGISRKAFQEFIAGRTSILSAQSFHYESEKITLSEYVLALVEQDEAFKKFLFSYGIQKKDMAHIVDWVVEREQAIKYKERWWSRERLGRIPGIGKNWSYGQISGLEAYIQELPRVTYDETIHAVYGSQELSDLEMVLSRTREAHALLVGDDSVGKLEIIARLQLFIDSGRAMPELEHKRIVVFDTERLLAQVKSKAQLESECMRLLDEAVHAGNVILVFPDFPTFIVSAEAQGSNIVALLEPYLVSSQLQLVCLTDVERYHTMLEPMAIIKERFDPILIKEIDESNTLRVIQNEVARIESDTKMFFTYPAITEIVESAERYFADGVMPDKALDLLLELVPKMHAQGKRIIRKQDVHALVESKTGIPVGLVKEEERGKLLNLEKVLHQRIIGQDEAITAISNAVRRARSGINNPKRPIASFLFLGPTGVGKTETTKALAQVFFGAEAHILRLDMSEYAGQDALPKLIGSFAGDRPGVLASLVRDHPYGVLLLDEFEKTTPEVMNLFLQILDEGSFSDMFGKHINTRNLLIIATSNAGSDMIWDAVKHGETLSHAKDIIIDRIIKTRVFKPELLNRFDGVIVFHPLGKEHLEKVARLQLEKLKARLEDRGLLLKINDDLVRYVMTFGTDPKFGARPMNRAIQDTVEQVIAEKMIRGSIKPGQEIELTHGELSNG